MRNGDYIGSHKIKLIEIFPLAFPYGWGGPDEKRATKISKAAILRHYCHIALPQMHESQFLLVLCSMWQRMESFTKCIINYKSSFKSSTLAEKLSEVTLQEVETAAKHVLNGEETTKNTLKNYLLVLKVIHHLLVILTKLHHMLDTSYFHYGTTLVLQLFFLLLHHVMNVVFV